MATRDTGGQQRGTRRADEVEEDAATPAPAEEGTARREKLSEDVDDLLDEIDEVLEVNAEEFVKGYVQKGGQ